MLNIKITSGFAPVTSRRSKRYLICWPIIGNLFRLPGSNQQGGRLMMQKLKPKTMLKQNLPKLKPR